MAKIRINELGKQLEVKSSVILEAISALGVTDKKTHSSAIEEDLAERVRRFVRGESEPAAPSAPAAAESPEAPPAKGPKAPKAPKPAAAAPPAPAAAEAVAPPTSEVAKAVAPSAPEAAAPAKPAPTVRRPSLRTAPPAETAPSAPAPRLPTAPERPKYERPKYSPPPAQPPASAQPPTAAQPPAPAESKPSSLRPAAPRPTTPGGLKPGTPFTPRTVAPFKPFVSATSTPAATPSAPAAPTSPTSAPTVRRPTLNISSPLTPAAGQPPAATPTPGAPAGRRIIVPVAPTRPTYTAPERPLRPTPGQPLTAGLAPGRPIYQRPSPGGRPAPGARTGVVPEGRRPMHPTRPGGGRDLPPRGAHHARREPRSKEGPQSSFTPAARSAPVTASVAALTISEGITVKDLAERLGIRAKDVIRKLLDRGLLVTVNQSLDTHIASEVSREFGAEATVVSFEQEALGASAASTAAAAEAAASEPGAATPAEAAAAAAAAEVSPTLAARAPVVTIMGHVDHGKTSLLDAIRQTSIAAGEAGGITQHIGAYKIEISDPASPAFGRKVVFIDTPGHAAFTRMRARGAKVTDIVVLVVAADDGVMPQTQEAIDHARAANVPIVVAINKIDKPDAQQDRVKKQLGDRGLLAEDWGGTTVTVPVSARAKTNLNLLLEMILLVSDIQDLKADPERPAQGVVLEAQLDRGRGPVARLLVQNGTLHSGDTVIVGSIMGRVRALFDDRSQPITDAGPSTPVELLGLDRLPDAGDSWLVMNDRAKARQVVQFREQKEREAAMARSARLNLEALSLQLARGDVKELNLIVKADVQGSEEVLVDTLNKLSTDKVKLRIIHSGVGAITENDILLASASSAIVIGFNVRPERKAEALAEKESVDIRLHSIIYELSDEIKKAMHGLLEPTFKETIVGRAEVQQVFRIPKAGTIAGCLVKDGKLVRDAQVRVVRDGAVVGTGRISSLKRFKDDATEVRNGLECGASVSNFNDLKPGDVLEAFAMEKVAPLMA